MILAHLPGFERHLKVYRRRLQDRHRLLYRAKVKEFNAWLIAGNRPTDPARITRQHIEDYLEHLFYNGNGNATRTTKRVAIGQFIRYLLYEEIISSDPTTLIPNPKVKKRFVQKFTRGEIIRILSAIHLRTEKGFRDFNIIMVAVFSGRPLGGDHKPEHRGRQRRWRSP